MSYNPGKYGFVSVNNSSSTPLTSSATFTGVGEIVQDYSSICVTVYTDQIGGLSAEFSSDGSNWDRKKTYSIPIGGGLYTLSSITKYFRIVYTNGGTNQGAFRLQTLFHTVGKLSLPTSSVEQKITDQQDCINTRSIITGKIGNGNYKNVNVDGNGHLEATIHGPLLPFGSVHVEKMLPIFQHDAVYGINDTDFLITQGSDIGLTGTVTAPDSSFICATGANTYGNATLQSKKRLRYKAGQGSIMRYTAKFSSPVTNSYQIAGFGHPEDGYYIGYKDTTFGILYINRHLRHIIRLEIATKATTAANCTITLNGTAYSVPLTVTGDIYGTSWEISKFTFTGWTVEQQGEFIYFLSNSSGDKGGSYTYTTGTTGSAGTFSSIRSGTSPAETFITQANFNMDTLDGSGDPSNPSGVTIDPEKLNVYQIGMQYLGAGSVVFSCIVNDLASTASNNSTWVKFHTIKNANNIILSHVGNPSFPYTMSAYKLNGGTSELTVEGCSVQGAIEGSNIKHGARLTYQKYFDTVDTSVRCVFAIKNSILFNGKPNQSVINLRSISAAARGANNVLTTVYLILNPQGFPGDINFTEYDSGRSCSLYNDVSSSLITYDNKTQLIFSTTIGETGEINNTFTAQDEEVTLQPGDILAVCVNCTTNTSKVLISLNTREDH